MSRDWIDSFCDLNAVKIPGPPGRWRRVYTEDDVRAVLRWADGHMVEEQRLRDLLTLRFERNDARLYPKGSGA